MTPLWKSGASPTDLRRVRELDKQIGLANGKRQAAIAERRGIVQRCYQKAARAKGRKG
jgi:hypothetical protein